MCDVRALFWTRCAVLVCGVARDARALFCERAALLERAALFERELLIAERSVVGIDLPVHMLPPLCLPHAT